MKVQKIIVFIIVVALIGGAAAAVDWFHANQKLGAPGIKVVSIPGSVAVKIVLPVQVLDFTSTNVPEDQIVLYMSKDTSCAQRRYVAPDGFQVNANVILMGADRTSIHKPDFCLPGQGWSINEKTVVNIPVSGVQNYQLPVAKWVVGNFYQTPDGKKVAVRGIYVFWFVADGEQTTDNNQRMWWLGRDLLRTGVLQRWAYVSFFSVCAPGQEEATFARMKQLIAASVPEFQLPPKLANAAPPG